MLIRLSAILILVFITISWTGYASEDKKDRVTNHPPRLDQITAISSSPLLPENPKKFRCGFQTLMEIQSNMYSVIFKLEVRDCMGEKDVHTVLVNLTCTGE